MARATWRFERDEEDLVRLYLNDVAEFGLLSKDDEVRLAQQIENGKAARERLAGADDLTADEERELEQCVRQGEKAQRVFVQSNLRLVVTIAKTYRFSRVPLLDLIQEGNLGLLRAVDRFDWSKGFKFSTFATACIRGAIARAIANTGRIIRLPVHAGNAIGRIQQVRASLEITLRRPATLAELAAEVDLPAEKCTEVLLFATASRSLQEPAVAGSDVELGDLIADDVNVSPLEAVMLAFLPRDVAELMSALDERERRIIALRYGFDGAEPRTLEEVGQHFQLTRERIRQIEARAMIKLRCAAYDPPISSSVDRNASRRL